MELNRVIETIDRHLHMNRISDVNYYYHRILATKTCKIATRLAVKENIRVCLQTNCEQNWKAVKKDSLERRIDKVEFWSSLLFKALKHPSSATIHERGNGMWIGLHDQLYFVALICFSVRFEFGNKSMRTWLEYFVKLKNKTKSDHTQKHNPE